RYRRSAAGTAWLKRSYRRLANAAGPITVVIAAAAPTPVADAAIVTWRQITGRIGGIAGGVDLRLIAECIRPIVAVAVRGAISVDAAGIAGPRVARIVSLLAVASGRVAIAVVQAMLGLGSARRQAYERCGGQRDQHLPHVRAPHRWCTGEQPSLTIGAGPER